MNDRPTDIYAAQHRGDDSAYDHYFKGMDSTMQQKLAFTTAHFLLRPGAVIADMGCGSGLGSYQFALLNPDVTVIGIDVNEEAVRRAREKYQLPNLRFEVGDAENPDPSLGPFDGILNSSILHHVYSFNNYDANHVANAVRNQFANLKPGGTIVIRDFVAWPDDKTVFLDLPAQKGGTTPQTMSDADLLILFSQKAKALKEANSRGFFLEEVASPDQEWRRFRLSAKWANEFILRKDYRQNWDVEVLEEYSWWTPEDYRRELTALGGRVVYTAPYSNGWIVDNRFKGKLRLWDEHGQPMSYPPTNFIAVVEKVAPEAGLVLRERSVSSEPMNFLDYSVLENTDGKTYEVVSRPGNVVDYMPYLIENNRLFVVAKHGYPRPIVNAVARGTANLDGKHWSGHLVEPIALGVQSDGVVGKLAERLGMRAEKLDDSIVGISYYPSPALVNEYVHSRFVPIDGSDVDMAINKPADASLSGFTESGDIRLYPAQDLLRASQVGSIAGARLEMNIYALMRHLNIKPDVWLGDALPAMTQTRFKKASLTEILDQPAQSSFKPSAESIRYLDRKRSVFTDICADGTSPSQVELEFVIPYTHSTNVISVLPLVLGDDGEIYVGLEHRQLPTPQLREGNSHFICAPAYRLPKETNTLDKAVEFIAGKMGQKPDQVVRLGESYFSSIGVTPERVFPYAIMVDPETVKEDLDFVPLRDLFQNLESLRDGHLMISALRATHALDKWSDYALAPSAALNLRQAGALPDCVP